MGVQMGGWALVDRYTSSLNLHKSCVCSGTGVCFCLAKSPSARHKTGEPACEEALSAHVHSVWWERQTCTPAYWALKNTFVPGLKRGFLWDSEIANPWDSHATWDSWYFRRKSLCSGVLWQLLEQHQDKASSSRSVHIRCHRAIIEIVQLSMVRL